MMEQLQHENQTLQRDLEHSRSVLLHRAITSLSRRRRRLHRNSPRTDELEGDEVDEGAEKSIDEFLSSSKKFDAIDVSESYSYSYTYSYSDTDTEADTHTKATVPATVDESFESTELSRVDSSTRLRYPSHLNPHLSTSLCVGLKDTMSVSSFVSNEGKMRSFNENEKSILEYAGCVKGSHSSHSIDVTADELKMVEFWVSVSFRQEIRISMLKKAATQKQLHQLEKRSNELFLVLFPCDIPSQYFRKSLPVPLTVYRSFSRFPKPQPRSFIVCAIALGEHPLDRFVSEAPSAQNEREMKSRGITTFIFTQHGIESIRLLDISDLVVLYSVTT
jgi:hypothetical protein